MWTLPLIEQAIYWTCYLQKKSAKSSLNGYQKYTLTEVNCEKIGNLKELKQDEVRSILCGMENSTCDLEPILTKLFKNSVDKCIEIISQGGNPSSNKWKIATVKPLIKKAGLELINFNFKPVGILETGFMSNELFIIICNRNGSFSAESFLCKNN